MFEKPKHYCIKLHFWLQHRQAHPSIFVFTNIHTPHTLASSNQRSPVVADCSKVHNIQPMTIAASTLHLRRIRPKLFQRRFLPTTLLLLVIDDVMARLPARAGIGLTPDDAVVNARAAVVGTASLLSEQIYE